MAEARRRVLIVLLKVGDLVSVALVFAALLIAFVQGQGYDTSKIVRVPQSWPAES